MSQLQETDCVSCLWELTRSVSCKIEFSCSFCFEVNIISAVQFKVPLAPLPNNFGFLKKKLPQSCSSCELVEATDDICLQSCDVEWFFLMLTLCGASLCSVC